MIVLIAGASHTGKTALAQNLSIDHLKMGLIRSGNTTLAPSSEQNELTAYLWPIVREMIKTAIENNQNLIVEGCYIPFDWKNDFNDAYRQNIKYYCLVMSEKYIRNNFDKISSYANVVESRIDDNFTLDNLLKSNIDTLTLAQKYNLNYILIDDNYAVDIDL